ncbi:hypothetical protein AAFF39_08385 [Lactococcus garvieae]
MASSANSKTEGVSPDKETKRILHEKSLKSSFSFPVDIQKIEICHQEQRDFLHTSSSEVLFDLAHKNLHFSLFA